MFNRFAAFHDFRRHGPAPALSLSNNNRAGHRQPARAGSPQRLACCWRQNRETSRLECRWKLASAGEIAPADVEREAQIVGCG
jgi:hypothetical protein